MNVITVLLFGQTFMFATCAGVKPAAFQPILSTNGRMALKTADPERRRYGIRVKLPLGVGLPLPVMKTLIDPSNIREILTKDGVSYTVVRDILNEYFPRLPICINEFDEKPYSFSRREAANWIYRARIVKQGEPCWTNVSDLTYIPKDKLHQITRHGRLNKPGQSVFYGSLGLWEASIETYAKGENMDLVMSGVPVEVVVGAWSLTEQVTFAQIPLPVEYVRKFMETPIIKALDLQFNMEQIEAQAAHVRGMINDDAEYKKLTYFSEAFARHEINDHREYMVSNYYADRVWNLIDGYPTDHVDGIMYYGLPSSYQKLNVAMLPEMVDKKLQFRYGYRLIVSHNPATGKTMFIPYEQQIRAKDGVIQWRMPLTSG